MANFSETDVFEALPSESKEGGYPCGLVYNFVSGFVVIGTVCIFGCVGNVLSMFVMWPDRNRSVTSFLLLVLAIVDILVLATRFTMRSLIPFCQFTGVCSGLENNIYLNTYGYVIAQSPHMATTWVTVLVTFHRFIVVSFPQHAQQLASLKRVRILTALVLSAIFIYTLPRCFENQIVLGPNSTELIAVRPQFSDTIGYKLLYRLVSYYLLMYLIPLVILVVLSYKLGRTIVEAELKRLMMTRKAKDKHDVTKSLVVIVIVFIVCQLPPPIRRILSSVVASDRQACPYFTYYVASISNFCICFNSAINFILYCVFGRRFRHSLQNLLCRGQVKVSPTTESTIKAHTSTVDHPRIPSILGP